MSEPHKRSRGTPGASPSLLDPADLRLIADCDAALAKLHSGERMPREFVYAMAWVKQAAARANVALGRLEARTAWAIERAAAEVIQGVHDAKLSTLAWQQEAATQAGAGFSEWLARRASALARGADGAGFQVDAESHVDIGAASADVLAITTQVATVIELTDRLLPAFEQLRTALLHRVQRGDAACAPLSLQDLLAHAKELEASATVIRQSLPALYQLGGSASHESAQFGRQMAAALSTSLGHPFIAAAPADPAAHAPVAAAHAALRMLACRLVSLATDLGALLATDARAPCDAMKMRSHQVLANDVSLSLAFTAGAARRRVLQPLIAHIVLHSVRLLTDGMNSFAADLVAPIDATAAVAVHERLERSLMLVTALVPHIGYGKASEIARKAHAERTTMRDAAVALGFASPTEFDRWVERPPGHG